MFGQSDETDRKKELARPRTSQATARMTIQV